MIFITYHLVFNAFEFHGSQLVTVIWGWDEEVRVSAVRILVWMVIISYLRWWWVRKEQLEMELHKVVFFSFQVII